MTRLASSWPYKFEILPLALLFVDEEYQRPVNDQFVRKIMKNWKPHLFGVLTVSRRAEKDFGLGAPIQYAVFDGQHRMKAARQLERFENVPCVVYDGLTREEEAVLFAELQEERRSLRPYDKFRARLFAGEPNAVGIQVVINDSKFELIAGGAYRATHITAVRAVEDAYVRGVLAQVLSVAQRAWVDNAEPSKEPVLTNDMLRGLTYYIYEYDVDGLDKERLIKALRRHKPHELLKRAGALREGKGFGGKSPQYLAEVIDDEYMKGQRKAS